MIFLKGFLLDRVRKVVFDLKLWGPLKNLKNQKRFILRPSSVDVPTGMWQYWIKISLDCPFKWLNMNQDKNLLESTAKE
jgi:hypothetical protein